MRTTVTIDDKLLARATELTGITEKSALLREGRGLSAVDVHLLGSVMLRWCTAVDA